MRTITLICLALVLASGRVLAHGDQAQGEEAVWTFDPWIVTPLLALGIFYAAGTLALWRQTSVRRPLQGWQTAAYWCGWVSIVGALVSPLHWLGEHLFSFHMIEHEILMAISAPLLVVARPIGTLLWALPRAIRVAIGRVLKRPAVSGVWTWLSTGRNATLLHGMAIWAWHVPVLFDTAVASVLFHRLQHLSFLVTALLFWWSVFRRSDSGLAAWHLFVTMLHTNVLGALMALAPRLLYDAQTTTSAAWGLTPLEDQQLAGIIMWIPAGTVYAGAALAMASIWIRQSGANGRRRDALGAF
jgi:cytochrome c oxidase assembly factor CtaG